MTRHLHLVLYLWASALMLSLTFIIPMTLPGRLALIAVVSGLMAMAWRYSQQTKNCLHRGEIVEGLEPALHAARRQPVVLVCGDSHRLFGTVDARAAVHFTAHACFVQVPAISQLPVITARVAAHPPNGFERLSVMLAISPLDHPDQAHLASQVRAACHQLSLARKAGAPLAFQIVIYLPGCGDDQTWFSWEAGCTRLNVRHVGTCTGVMEWQDQAMDEALRAQRLRACVQLNSVSQWLAEAVLPHLPVEARCVACSAMLVPELPHLNDANLWHQWLGENIALDSTRRASGDGTDRMPFPDTLVALLPPVARHRAARRASVAMLWMFTLAASIALTSSGWQNARLLRQVSADIGLYRALAPVQRPDEPGFALRENAAKVLQQHAVSLEDHYRNGVPLSLGLGLYRADRLRVPLLATLADYRSPLPENTDHVLAPIRLNSLSLFAVGSARLKPDSTKVLIQALHRLRAQPGWLIVITGHTDATGPAEHNLQLSRARAEAVRDWMQRMGEIHDSCFAVQGLGASQPIASNDIEVGRSANRRVDIRLVPEAGACLSSPPMPDLNPPSHEAA